MKKYLFILTFILLSCRFTYGQDYHWDVDIHKYANNMSVTASIEINGVEQKNTDIEVAAFAGDEVRGRQRVQLYHIENEDVSVDKYRAYLTVYGEDGDVMTFKIYDHNQQKELDYVTDNSITFVTNATMGSVDYPYAINFVTPPYTFAGDGVWDENTGTIETDDVIIDGNIVITSGSDITVNSLVINENKSLTIQNGGVLRVIGDVVNSDVDALIIEEGGQIFQNNDDVAVTFKNNIENPAGEWGLEDITGWQFIASPVANADVNDFIPTNGDYDLYMYDGTSEHQWRNIKNMGSVVYNFDTDASGWTSISTSWMWNNGCMTLMTMASVSYLVSPQTLISDNTKLRFKSNSMYEINVQVLLSEEGNDVAEKFNKKIGDFNVTATQTSFEADLSAYKGKRVYLAFYVNVSGMNMINIDDVKFINENFFEQGRGYLVSYELENSIAEFKGNLNNEPSYLIKTNEYSQEDNLSNFSLLGNPYPFDIDWKKNFVLEGVYDGYAIVDSEDGSYRYFTDGVIKTGEGFMVKSVYNSNNEVLVSKTAIRNAEKASYINVNSSGKQGSDNVIICFDDEEISGFPKLRNFNENIAAVYVKEGNMNYGIKNYDNDVKEIPLYFEAKEMGSYTLTFDINADLEMLYLIDKMSGEKVNVLLENEYTFIATSNDNADRFVLTMSDVQNIDDLMHEKIGNFAYINDGNLIIGRINGKAQIRIIDALGRCVYDSDCIDDEHIVPTSEFISGVYMIQKVNDKGIEVQKMIL